MSEILRKSFESNAGGDLLGPNDRRFVKAESTKFPSRRRVHVTPPSWRIYMDIHGADLSIAGIGEAAQLLRNEVAEFDPPQTLADNEIVVGMPKGSNITRKGYNVRFIVTRQGIPPSVPNLDEYDIVNVQGRNPAYVFSPNSSPVYTFMPQKLVETFQQPREY